MFCFMFAYGIVLWTDLKKYLYVRRVLIIIMYIYRALINALSAHIIHINLNTIFYTHVEESPTKKCT